MRRNNRALGKLSGGHPGNLSCSATGGVAVFLTPNILNLRSRLRYLSSSFYNLFEPLAPDESDIHTTRERNAWAVRAMNLPKLLLGRTLIVTALKPA
jgi:hypothetical protein